MKIKTTKKYICFKNIQINNKKYTERDLSEIQNSCVTQLNFNTSGAC